MEPLVISQIVLWIMVVILALTVLALVRQIGVLHERGGAARRAQLDEERGRGRPAAPQFDVIDLAGRPLHIGGRSPDGAASCCCSCRRPAPCARSCCRSRARSRAASGAASLRADGRWRPAIHEALIAEHRLQDVPFALAPIVGINLGIGKLPQAVLIDQGVIRSKGIVNSREHLESLLIAQETGYASMQDYLRGAPETAGLEAGSEMTGGGSQHDARCVRSHDGEREPADRPAQLRRSVLTRLGTA